MDFYAAPHDARTRCALRAGIARGFWRRWFRHDCVNIDQKQLPYLRGLRTPYYLYIGRKAGS